MIRSNLLNVPRVDPLKALSELGRRGVAVTISTLASLDSAAMAQLYNVTLGAVQTVDPAVLAELFPAETFPEDAGSQPSQPALEAPPAAPQAPAQGSGAPASNTAGLSPAQAK